MTSSQRNLFDPDPAPWELDDGTEALVATIVLREGPGGEFDYLVPDSLIEEVAPGKRVKVPFGRGNRSLIVYCVRVEMRKVAGRRLKAIQAVMDERPLLSSTMLQMTAWMADYYLCDWGTVLEGVLPAGVRAQAGTRKTTFLSVPTSVAARLTQINLPPKQQAALRALAASPRPLTPAQLSAAADCTGAPIAALRKKKLIHAEERRVHQAPGEETPAVREEHHPLNADQQAALDSILAPLRAERHETLVVHGVTGSGKTEVYIRAIEEVISYGRQAIVLVPEISLTPQTRSRFRSRFNHVAVLHSHLSPAERHWHWQRIARGEVEVVVGARSAVFAPTPHLGLIVIDEEHDWSFKQDTAPRYHAREVAIYRAQAESAPLVIGSATPSLESYVAARKGEFRLLEMPRRVYDRPLPDVGTIDLRNEFHSRNSRGAISRPLHMAITAALGAGGQVILLLNRRGFSTHIQCPACGNVMQCPDCDIALTHHRDDAKAICHYCDYEALAPQKCPDCGFEGIRYSGLGTQRLEAEVRARFPEAKCLRMDSDTMQKPGSHEAALDRFRQGEVQILLGTQMIAKGLDFPNVTLVGVINADTALHLPDFRAAERTFQLVTQVAGRTGRGEKGGRVLVQTFSPEHPAIQAAVRHDYTCFAREEIPNRREYGYPPLAGLVRLVVRGEQRKPTEMFAEQLGERITAAQETLGLKARLLGPTEAPIAKLRGKYRYHMLVQAVTLDTLRQLVRHATADLKPPDDVQWIVDVDPLDMM